MYKTIQFNKFLLYAILASFTFVLIALTNRENGMYAVQIFVQALCLLIFFLRLKIDGPIAKILLMMLCACWLQVFFNSNHFRYSTVVYTSLFVFTFLVYRRLLETVNPPLETFVRWIKIVLFSFFVVLIVQQIQSLNGFSVFNYASDGVTKFKLNSLASESSNLTMVVCAYFFTYIKCREIQCKGKYNFSKCLKKDLMVWISFIYTSLTCASMSGFIAVAVFMLYFVNKRNVKYVIIAVAIFVLIVPLFAFFQIFDLTRLEHFLSILMSFDPMTLIEEDPSAACRVIPYWVYIQSINPIDIHFWIGHGIDQAESVSKHLILSSKYTRETIDLSRNIGSTNITAFFYDYGFVAALLFIKSLKRIVSDKWKSYEMFMYVALFAVLPINHRTLWLFLMLMTTIRYYKRNESSV